MNRQSLTLDHPEVQATKVLWEESPKRVNRKNRLSFEDLFRYFDQGLTYARIAELAGVSAVEVFHIYHRYFRPLFKEGRAPSFRSDRERPRDRSFRIKQAEDSLLSENRSVRKIVEKAREAGCNVATIAAAYRVLSKRLRINGRLCALYKAPRQVAEGNSFVVYLEPSILGVVYAVVIHWEPYGYQERTFVIPTSTLTSADWEAKSEKFKFRLPSPEKASGFAGGSPLDYAEFEDAWHLLPPNEDTPAP